MTLIYELETDKNKISKDSICKNCFQDIKYMTKQKLEKENLITNKSIVTENTYITL